uniref:Uncharacterized protein n=1 Tax=Moniliophthora roreri TaxID=221103 RepID=A0A0W0EUR1_MONRR
MHPSFSSAYPKLSRAPLFPPSLLLLSQSPASSALTAPTPSTLATSLRFSSTTRRYQSELRFRMHILKKEAERDSLNPESVAKALTEHVHETQYRGIGEFSVSFWIKLMLLRSRNNPTHPSCSTNGDLPPRNPSTYDMTYTPLSHMST